LSWVDTIASVVGRGVGPRSPPLPSTIPGLPFIPLAKRKSLAGYLAAAVTGFIIAVAFWWDAPHTGKVDSREWGIFGQEARKVGGEFLGQPVGLWSTGLITGLFGATVEAWGGFEVSFAHPSQY
jgi:diacylglycerol kinase (CTP)